MEQHTSLSFEGCNLFRQRITYSLLSGTPIKIFNIRPFDDSPGITDFEVKLISIIENITNGTVVQINLTGI